MTPSILSKHCALLLSTCALLTACATVTAPFKRDAVEAKTVKPVAATVLTASPTLTTPSAPSGPTARQQLNQGIELYNKGDYQNAIRRLSSAKDAAQGDTATQLLALKYLAFNYCVTGQKTLCQQQFEHALRIDPSFDLAAGEKGHPLWGPVFNRVKKAK